MNFFLINLYYVIFMQSLLLGLYFNFKNKRREKVVLLGQGWFARGFMEHIDKNKFYVVNVTRHEFVNTPFLLKDNYEKNNKFITKIDKIINDKVKKIDLDTKNIHLEKSILSWKNGYLVCGLGSNEDIGKKWLNIRYEIFNNKIFIRYCIIGSGPTGTELAFFLADKYNNVTILDMIDKDSVFSYLSKSGKELLLNRLDMFKIELLTNTPFTENMRSQYDNVIFATGSRPNDLMKDWKITPRLNLENHSDVFFGGDCVYGSILPRNAQVAYQQGKYVAETLNGDEKKDFKFENKGIAIYVGNDYYYIEKIIKWLIPKYFVELYYKL